jgi:cysteine desulfurase
MSIYLDHAATTGVDARVLEAMLPYFSESYGNASSLHRHGKSASAAVLAARKQVANALSADHRSICFTCGGTESDNWAIRGAAEYAQKGHIITTSVEHPAVLETCSYLEKKGFSVTRLPVDRSGRIDPDSLQKAIRKDTFLISVMYANNETGTLMPIAEIGRIAREHGIPFHCDAVQAVGHVPVDVDACHIDLLSLSAHKFYGPKGVGALYIRDKTPLCRFMLGGQQEDNRRAGTLNTPGIVGLGRAVELAVADLQSNAKHEANLADRLLAGALEIEGVRLNGHLSQRLPGHLNLAFCGKRADALYIYLDRHGISASRASACSARRHDASHVLLAMGLDNETALSSLRFSIGRENTPEEIDEVIKIIGQFYLL